jgi:hypothetical protein
MDDSDDDFLDPELARGLGNAAPALREWGRLKEIRYRHDRWLTNGKSTALVAVVYEDDLQEGAQKLILKLDRISDEDLGTAEYVRQRRAWLEAPDFANRHLAQLASAGHDLVRVGEGRWILFQKIAGGSVDHLDVLTKYLASARIGGGPISAGGSVRRTVTCDSAAFAAMCGKIVDRVLTGWQGKPALERRSAPAFIADHLSGRQSRKGILRNAAAALTAPALQLPDEPGPLPNPLRLAFHDQVTDGRIVQALLGRAHGDLHTENILIPGRGSLDPSPFRLIDLARYANRAPLTRDPTYLTLYIIARTLEDLSAPQADALIDVLVDPECGRDSVLPGWLRELLRAVKQAGERWAHSHGFTAEWRSQTVLSLVGSALVFLDRPSTRDADRMWFLRLAARAGQTFLGPDWPVRGTDTQLVDPLALLPDRTRPAVSTELEWVARLCEYLPYMRLRAGKQGRLDEVEEMERGARAGADLTDAFIELVRQLGGPTDNLRDPYENNLLDEVYACPIETPCARVERADSSDAEPICHLKGGRMRPEFW